MASAQETAVTKLLHLEGLCKDCELREGGNRQPDYIELEGYRIGDNNEILAQAKVSSKEYERKVEFRGIPDSQDVKEAFAACEGSEIFEDRIICGAFARVNRRNRNGREKI